MMPDELTDTLRENENLRAECARLRADLEVAESRKSEVIHRLTKERDEAKALLADTAGAFRESEANAVRILKERDAALAERDEERKIVDRVWKALGISTFLGAGGIAIDEHVSRAIASAKSAEEEAGRLRELLGLCSRRCEDLHHGPRDRHGSGVACPVEARIDSALKEPR